MSNAIPLPPLPVPETWDKRYTADQLRARDQEIVRCVLQALANEFEDWDGTKLIVSKIHNMEFHHE